MTYEYNASALALGGVLKHANGTTTDIPSIASVHLAPTGGHGSEKIADYNKYGVSFTIAHSRVNGSDSGHRTFTTNSNVYMTNLNLFGRVQVDYLETSIISTRDVFAGDPEEQSDPDSARFWMHSTINGLVVDGVEVTPEFDLELSACATHEQFTNRIRAGVGAYAEQFGVKPNELANVLRTNVQPIRGSFVSALHTPTDKIGRRKGFTLPVKNFGNMHFGELVVKPGHRRVNLLRIEFNSKLALRDSEEATADMMLAGDESMLLATTTPKGGSMTVLSLYGNGAPSWP